MHKQSLILGICASFLLMACGGGDDNSGSSSGGTTGGDPTIEELADKVKDKLCENATMCHRFESVADCEASTNTETGQIKASVDAGKIKYDASSVDTCLNALSAIFTCSITEQAAMLGNDTPDACTKVFTGTVADGGKCVIDDECVSTECEIPDTCMEACCEGTCVKPTTTDVAKLGESCATLSCEDGTYCKYDMNFMPTVCTTESKEGEACDDLGSCAFPLNCVAPAGMTMGTCKKPAAHGADCDSLSFFACDLADDYCDETTKKCATRKLPGEACSDLIPCVAYADCGADNKCAKQGAEGAACDMASNECLGDLQCTNSKCAFDTETVCP